LGVGQCLPKEDSTDSAYPANSTLNRHLWTNERLVSLLVFVATDIEVENERVPY